MSQKHYALLVGVDRYLDTRVSKLDAPKYDVQRMKDYLTQSSGLHFEVETLLVESPKKPTRENIITYFHKHLIEHAAKGVILVFYFSGHGSTEIADELFVQRQGNRVNETLICYDSRTNGIWDLADKELKWLIHQAAEKQAEFIAIIDSCHSGSVTRLGGDGQIWKSRNTPTPASDVPRPLDTYLKGSVDYHEIPRHVLLSACRKDQQAREIKTIEGANYVYSGLFTSKLLHVLNNTSTPLTYRDLMTKCGFLVQRSNPYQFPQLDAFDFFDTYRYFLNLNEQVNNRHKYLLNLKARDHQLSWVIDFGLSRGMPYDTNQMATFQLFADEQLKIPIGKAKVSSVGINESLVNVEFDLNQDSSKIKECYGVPTFLPIQKLGVYSNVSYDKLQLKLKETFENDPFGLQCINTVVEWNFDHQEFADFFLKVEDNGDYTLMHADTEEVIFPCGKSETQANSAHFSRLSTVFTLIESWKRYLQIAQPIYYSKFHNISNFPLKLTIYNEKEEKQISFSHHTPHEIKEITLDFPGEHAYIHEFIKSNKKELIIAYQLEFFNDVQTLHLYLIGFEKDYSIRSFFSGDSETLAIKQKFEKRGFSLPSHKNQEVEFFKIFMGEQPFDKFMFEQNSLCAPSSAHRDVREDKKPLSDWFTRTLKVKLLRDLGDVGTKSLAVPGSNISIKNHPSFTAKVSLISTARSAHSHELDYHLSAIANQLNWGLLDFSYNGQLETLLELHHMKNQATVTAQQPLSIELEALIENNQELIAVTLPMDFLPAENPTLYLTLGKVYKRSEGKFELVITHIPQNPDDGRFNPGFSLKIAFFIVPINRQILGSQQK